MVGLTRLIDELKHSHHQSMHPHSSLHSSSSSPPLDSTTRDERYHTLCVAMERYDEEGSDMIGAVEIGQSLAQLSIIVQQGTVDRILSQVDHYAGRFNYRQFCWELSGENEGGRQGRRRREREVIQVLNHADEEKRGILSAMEIGKVISTLPHPIPSGLLR